MLRHRKTWLVAVLFVGVPSLAMGAPVAPSQTIAGGGTGGSSWTVGNTGGTNNGLPTGGVCSGSLPGMSMVDASLGGQGDAFDYGMTLWVDNSIFATPALIDLTSTVDGVFYTAGPVAMSGLDVTMQYFIDAETSTARTFASFSNPTGAAIRASMSWVTNMGSDSSTQVITTVSGDATFTTADRYVITDDGVTTAGDPAITHVLYGPGGPSVTPSSVSQIVFECATTDGILAVFDMVIPAGATRHLMFFNELDASSADATAGVGVYDNLAGLSTAGMLAGLSNSQLANTVNWTAVPEPGSLATFAIGTFVLGVALRRKK